MFKFLMSVLMSVLMAVSVDAGAAPVRKTTVARAGATQKVVNTGTKIAAAKSNSLVGDECQETYFGCMDAFCMVDNVSGGRCQCSGKHADLMNQLKILTEDAKKTQNIALLGAEVIQTKSGNADVWQAAESVAKNLNDETDKKKPNISFEDWNNQFASDDEEEYDDEINDKNIFSKSGDALYVETHKLCWEKAKDKCQSKEDMVKILYMNKIKGDCAAFENSLKQQKQENTVRLAEANKVVRDAALKDFKESNKYDLGQCVLSFKECMQTTAECGKDFSGCVYLSVLDNMNNVNKNTVAITDDVSIMSETMDILLAKRPMCEYVLNNCESVKDGVWDAFLKESAVNLKSAESIVESDMRTSCLAKMSNCYLKTCKENIDPEDPDGSYDLCLSRPDVYKSLCKVEMEPCLVATGGSFENPESSRLWSGLLAKLSSMRVDACTTEFKQCLQSEERCGEDYSQCIGLSIEEIVGFCPEEKLIACRQEYADNTETVRESLEKFVQGVLLQTQDGLLSACQKAVEQAMINLCGDTETCLSDNIILNNLGANSLGLRFCEMFEKDGKTEYINCRADASAITDADVKRVKQNKHAIVGVIDGTVNWGLIDLLPDAMGVTGSDEYYQKLDDSGDESKAFAKESIKSEIDTVSSSVHNAITLLENDLKVQYCMYGRKLPGLEENNSFVSNIPEDNKIVFPNITKSYRISIINSVLEWVSENYDRKYKRLLEDKMFYEKKFSE